MRSVAQSVLFQNRNRRNHLYNLFGEKENKNEVKRKEDGEGVDERRRLRRWIDFNFYFPTTSNK